MLEKLAAPIAPFVVGRTGRQLFLTDGKASDPPLLLRMASDCSEGLFMYVLSLHNFNCFYSFFLLHFAKIFRTATSFLGLYLSGAKSAKLNVALLIDLQICAARLQVESGICECQL